MFLYAATVVSLVLCVATVVLWVRSYRGTDSLSIRVPGEVERPGDHGPLSLTFGVASSRGALVLTRWEDETRVRIDEPYPPPPPTLRISAHHSPGPWQVERGWQTRRWHGYAGFFSGSEYYSGSGASSDLRYFALPYWCPVLVLTLMASPVLRRSRRQRPGLCPSCGYDLRATPDRCPECGRRPCALRPSRDP
jgi:hypothetical protein